MASQPDLLKSLAKVATTVSLDGTRSSTAVDLASQRSRPAPPTQAVASAAVVTVIVNDQILNPSANKPDSGKLSNGEVDHHGDMTQKAEQLKNHHLDEARCQSTN